MLHSRKHQQGISLYIVIVIVLLSTLLALWSSRTSIFNEMIVGNDADYQRAYEAAQATMQDAKTDIQISNSLDDCIRKPNRPCRSNNKDNKNNTNIVPMPDVSVSDLVAKLSTEETKWLMPQADGCRRFLEKHDHHGENGQCRRTLWTIHWSH